MSVWHVNLNSISFIYFFSVFAEYNKISGRDLDESIKREMSGSLADVFLAIGESVPPLTML